MSAQETITTGYGGTKVNYLTNGTTLKSWLLTKDHKRIAIMYLITVSLFFLGGGLFAAATTPLVPSPPPRGRGLDSLSSTSLRFAEKFGRDG